MNYGSLLIRLYLCGLVSSLRSGLQCGPLVVLYALYFPMGEIRNKEK